MGFSYHGIGKARFTRNATGWGPLCNSPKRDRKHSLYCCTMAESLMLYWDRAVSVVPAANRPTSARTVDDQWFDVHLTRFDGSDFIVIVIDHKKRSDLHYGSLQGSTIAVNLNVIRIQGIKISCDRVGSQRKRRLFDVNHDTHRST